MPTYEYRCSECGHGFEEFQSMSAVPLMKCPNCGKDTLRRVMGGGAGMIFKGKGFYLTDYKKGTEKPSAPANKTPEKDSKGSPPPSPPEKKPKTD